MSPDECCLCIRTQPFWLLTKHKLNIFGHLGFIRRVCRPSTSCNTPRKWQCPVKPYEWNCGEPFCFCLGNGLEEDMQKAEQHTGDIFLTQIATESLMGETCPISIALSLRPVSKWRVFLGWCEALWGDFHFTNIFTALTVCNPRGHGSQFTSPTTTSEHHMRQLNITAPIQITSKGAAETNTVASGLVVRIN